MKNYFSGTHLYGFISQSLKLSLALLPFSQLWSFDVHQWVCVSENGFVPQVVWLRFFSGYHVVPEKIVLITNGFVILIILYHSILLYFPEYHFVNNNLLSVTYLCSTEYYFEEQDMVFCRRTFDCSSKYYLKSISYNFGKHLCVIFIYIFVHSLDSFVFFFLQYFVHRIVRFLLDICAVLFDSMLWFWR